MVVIKHNSLKSDILFKPIFIPCFSEPSFFRIQVFQGPGFSEFLPNEIQFSFRFSFSWRNWKKNYVKRSRLTLWLFSQVSPTRYSRASSCQLPWNFLLCNGHVDNKDPLFKKQLMYFKCLYCWLLLLYLFYSYSYLRCKTY